MKVTKNEIVKVEQLLNEAYSIAKSFGDRPADQSYYVAIRNTIELLGFDWKRNAKGEHRIFKD